MSPHPLQTKGITREARIAWWKRNAGDRADADPSVPSRFICEGPPEDVRRITFRMSQGKWIDVGETEYYHQGHLGRNDVA